MELMKRRPLLTLLVTAIVVTVFAANEARGGTITGLGASSLPGFSTGTIGPVGNTPSPNNDNSAVASPNVIPYSIFYNTFGTAEVEFVVVNSGGTSEYRITQTLLNTSGQVWAGLHFELGFGTGAGFVVSTASDAVDFDIPDLDPAATAFPFPTLGHQADTLDWSGAVAPVFSPAVVSFHIDVPDDLQLINPSGLNRFTLRQTPVAAQAPVPEPGSALFLLSGLAVCLVFSRRAKRNFTWGT